MIRLACGMLVIALLSAWDQQARARDEKQICASAYTDAQSLRNDHRLLAASDQLRVCARAECSPFMSGGIVKDCAQWLGEVEIAIPSVVLQAQDESGADIVDVIVMIDGAPLATKLDGRAIEVDAGTHVFTFTATWASAQRTVVVIEGKKSQVVKATFASPKPSEAQNQERDTSKPRQFYRAPVNRTLLLKTGEECQSDDDCRSEVCSGHQCTGNDMANQETVKSHPEGCGCAAAGLAQTSMVWNGAAGPCIVAAAVRRRRRQKSRGSDRAVPLARRVAGGDGRRAPYRSSMPRRG